MLPNLTAGPGRQLQILIQNHRHFARVQLPGSKIQHPDACEIGEPTASAVRVHSPQPTAAFMWRCEVLRRRTRNANHTADAVGSPGCQPLGDEMHSRWTRFIKTGDAGWPCYDLATRPTMRFDTNSGMVADPLAERRQLWKYQYCPSFCPKRFSCGVERSQFRSKPISQQLDVAVSLRK